MTEWIKTMLREARYWFFPDLSSATVKRGKWEVTVKGYGGVRNYEIAENLLDQLTEKEQT